MKLRNPGKLTSQMFSCAFLCSDVVLSPSQAQIQQQQQQIQEREFVKENVRSESENRRFQRVPSSTQWELALKLHKRSLKGSPKKDPPEIRKDSLQIPKDSLETLVKQVCSAATLGSLRSLAYQVENRMVMVDMDFHVQLVGLLDSDLMREAFDLLLVLAGDQRVVHAVVHVPGVCRCLERFLQTGSGLEKVAAVEMLVKVSENVEFNSGGLVVAVLALLHEREEKVVRAGVKGLLALCLSKGNRVAAARAGAVDALLAVLEQSKGMTAERCLASLELLSTTVEGRSAVKEHALGVNLLLNMILRVSDRGTEYAAGVLCSVCTANDVEVLETACQARASTLLLLLLQSNCTERARRKALKLLKVLHCYTVKERVVLRENIQH